MSPARALLPVLLLAACTPRAAPPEVNASEPTDSLSDGGQVAMDAATVARLVAVDPLWERALAIHYDAIVIDGHVDTPWWILDEAYDPNVRHEPLDVKHQVDFPRMEEAGLDGAFFAAWVSGHYGEGSEATDRALALIDALERSVAASGGRAEMARTAADVVRIARAGRRAVLVGLEGGHALQASPEVLRRL